MMPPVFSRRGRPLRFLATALGGWTAMRFVALSLPAGTGPIPVRLPSAAALASAAGIAPAEAVTLPPVLSGGPPQTRGFRPLLREPAKPPALKAAPATLGMPSTLAWPQPAEGLSATPAAQALRSTPPVADLIRFGAGPAPSRTGSRWSASFWSIVRDDDARASTGGIATPQLGGSQAGARLSYALDDARRWAAVGRMSSALGVPQQEAALGLEWQSPVESVRLVAEYRIGVRGLGSGPALGAVGGVSDVPIAAGARLDAYGQAGVILRDGAQGYADGSVRVARKVARLGDASIDLGLGAWGAAQRGARRLDAGPGIALSLPVAGHSLRATLDWRARITGNARPASGVVVGVGVDL